MAGGIPCWMKSQYCDKQNPNILLPNTDCLPHAEHWKKLQLLTSLIHLHWKEEATVLNVYIRENVSKL
jgi:hypothetical protein